ncbi:transcriptional regulator NanR [Pelagibius litoralis]|uniref:Transcriptional regulator NanR n=1 Tax=Pelagibius litoralis TaxID=374515 RepID=A0A967EWV2_9PROT|nr:transcriptional regulator NanR [Pelagibius litoralis]NIA68523.1 transcriptional regulator NanR [Pelagibius litoralis]
MTSLKPKATKQNIAHGVRKRLLAMLESETFGPGDPLPSERELMEMFNVGRPAVREAMQSLQVMGLVEIRHGGRAKVAEPSLGRMVEQIGETMRHLLATSSADLEHLKDARFAFEKASAERAARRRTESDLQRLRNILKLQDEARDNMSQFLIHDREFHRSIAAISGNPIYTALSEAMFSWLADFHIDVVLLPGREQLTLDEHNEILNAIEARDPGRAAKAMHDHLTRANVLYHRTHLSSPDQ